MNPNLAVIVLGALTGVVLVFLCARSRATSRDLNDQDAVLAEVEILLAYGRERQALDLLNQAIHVRPDAPRLVSKLAELNAGVS